MYKLIFVLIILDSIDRSIITMTQITPLVQINKIIIECSLAVTTNQNKSLGTEKIGESCNRFSEFWIDNLSKLKQILNSNLPDGVEVNQCEIRPMQFNTTVLLIVIVSEEIAKTRNINELKQFFTHTLSGIIKEHYKV